MSTSKLRWVSAGAVLGFMLAASSLAASPSAIPSGNLVTNPGAEDSPGTPTHKVVKPVGWTTTGNLSTYEYAAREGDFPTQAFAATIGGGKNFFAGGPGDNSGKQSLHTAAQTIDVSGAATEIDAGQVGATLTAFIGGYTTSKDLATVTARFLDAAGAELGILQVGPVSSDDRKNLTVLLQRTAQANLPANTRTIGVVIAVKADGNGAHHAFVDNISLTLGKASPAAGKATLTAKCAAKKIIATVKPATGQKITSVKFSAAKARSVQDVAAPFTARFPTKGLPARIVVKAQVTSDSPIQNLTASVKRC